MSRPSGLFSRYDDVWLLDGVRTPFVDYVGPFGLISPTDLGIKVAKEIFLRTGISVEDVGHVFAGSMAQADFDAYMLPRHIGLYAGVPMEIPATLTQRVCGTGFELLIQAGDRIQLGQIELGLCVGTESMSRNPVAAYTHRGGFRMGQIEFKDFLWEATLDTSCGFRMGDTAENLAREYGIERHEVDAYAALSFERAVQATQSGFLGGEIAAVANEKFELPGYRTRAIRLPRNCNAVLADTHIRSTSQEALAAIRPAFDGVQTGGNSSAIVDGAAAALVACGTYLQKGKFRPLARVLGGFSVGVPPEIMGIGPAFAIRGLVERMGMTLDQIDLFEINEAFGCQILACLRNMDISTGRVNVNGGAIAIGHPLAATGLRLTTTIARELRRRGLRYGISSACVGGGQGVAILVENPGAAS